MDAVQGTMFRSLVNARTFLDEHATALGAVATTATRKELDVVIATLQSLTVDQVDHTLAVKELVLAQRTLRGVLYTDHMLPIARVARLHLPKTAELAPLRVPTGTPSVERLAAAASGMGKAATRYAEVFIGAGLPQDFVAQLDTATTDLVQSFKAREQLRHKGGAVTATLRAELAKGRRIVNVLDSFITKAVRGDVQLLHNWKRVKRVPKTTRAVATSSSSPSTPDEVASAAA